jgi:2,3-bisphosphoglycerate-independent phosphoglycerate mutase
MATTTLLCVLDGFGLNPNPVGNAVAQAKKPNIDALFAKYPNSTLTTFGEAVGLPAGQMGNSEVGHLNVGAGRVVEQWLLRISRALSGPFLASSSVYQSFISATKPSKAIHVVGLYSTGGVHSHSEHLKLLLKRLRADNSSAEIVLHLISDGRDVSPNAFLNDLTDLLETIKGASKITLGSVCGRFYAMDRDKRWERVKLAYDAIACAEGATVTDFIQYVKDSYARGTTDEFLEPAVSGNHPIREGDGLVFFNFREDRMREIVAALCTSSFASFERKAPIPDAAHILCFTEYDHTYHLPYLFEQLEIKNHLGETVAKAGLEQLRVAETEKYPHVTYFLNGGVEQPYAGEDRKLVPSPRDVKTYDMKPEMSAFGVTELVVDGIRSGKYSLIVVNFANCDMVGHTGVVEAGIKAVETVDTCLGQILSALQQAGGRALVIADHGNAEQMINYQDGTPHTAHTTYPVPVILVGVSGNPKMRDGGALCDVAPTVLKMMGLPQPEEMTGKSLY